MMGKMFGYTPWTITPGKEQENMADDVVKKIRTATRCKFTAEEKIRIVIEGLCGEIPLVELSRREGISPAIYYRWSKSFLDAGKNGLTKDTKRDATSDEVRRLKEENADLKNALGEQMLDNLRMKKNLVL
jgi:transposase